MNEDELLKKLREEIKKKDKKIEELKKCDEQSCPCCNILKEILDVIHVEEDNSSEGYTEGADANEYEIHEDYGL